MKFTMSNGAPACFAVDRAAAEVILGTDEIAFISYDDFIKPDWQAATLELGLQYIGHLAAFVVIR